MPPSFLNALLTIFANSQFLIFIVLSILFLFYHQLFFFHNFEIWISLSFKRYLFKLFLTLAQ